jgi:elongation factor G
MAKRYAMVYNMRECANISKSFRGECFMKEYSSDSIRNIVLLGHGGAGKTSLAETMLFNAGVTERMGKVTDGNTVSDFDQEETARQFSINLSVIPYEWNDKKVNIIDTPGFFDFAGEVKEGISVADAAVIVVAARSGIEVGTEKAFDMVTDEGISKMFFINRLDEENIDIDKVLSEMKEKFGVGVTAFQYPIIENGRFTGLIDVIKKKALMLKGADLVETVIPANLTDKIDELHNAINEAIAETDEELLEKFFAEEPFTPEEVISGIKKGIADGSIAPVFMGSATSNLAIKRFSDILVDYFPAPTEGKPVKAKRGEEEIEVKCDPNEKFSAFVFKTIADPFVGKISIFRVCSGTLTADTDVINQRMEKQEKINHIYVLRGKKQIEIDKLFAGDIGAFTKLQFTDTNDTLYEKGNELCFEKIEFADPVVSYAVETSSKGDEDKIGNGLQRLREEDPTFMVVVNSETKQTLVSGTGEQHIRVIVSKLATKYGVKVNLKEPKVPYRETIKKKVTAEGKHKKQSGGHGQYGHVIIEFEPGETEELEFGSKVVGGSVPKNYFPAVEKGLLESMQKGIYAGYPVVFLKATLMDGSYHPVDSSEMAFKLAASIAYKKGLTDAGPALLEPIQHIEVYVPEPYMGDILGDLNKRRGRVMGMNPQPKGIQQIVAEVPLAEIFSYAPDLNSMTQGRGYFTSVFERYEEVPTMIAEKVRQEAEKEEEE